MDDLTGKLFAAVCAVIATKAVDAILKRREKPRIVCESRYSGFPVPKVGSSFGPEVVDAFGKIFFRLQFFGGSPIKNVRIRLDCGRNELVGWCWFVGQLLDCQRLQDRMQHENSGQCVWAYINPGDVLDLEVEVRKVTDPSEIRLEIDAEGLLVHHKRTHIQCDVQPRSGTRRGA
jgi:hypothetical protein